MFIYMFIIPAQMYTLLFGLWNYLFHRYTLCCLACGSTCFIYAHYTRTNVYIIVCPVDIPVLYMFIKRVQMYTLLSGLWAYLFHIYMFVIHVQMYTLLSGLWAYLFHIIMFSNHVQMYTLLSGLWAYLFHICLLYMCRCIHYCLACGHTCFIYYVYYTCADVCTIVWPVGIPVSYMFIIHVRCIHYCLACGHTCFIYYLLYMCRCIHYCLASGHIHVQMYTLLSGLWAYLFHICLLYMCRCIHYCLACGNTCFKRTSSLC